MIAGAALLGLLVGTALAVFLDRLYTGAPWRGPILPCGDRGHTNPVAVRSGLPGYLLARGRCAVCGERLPRRLALLPLAGALTFGTAAARLSGVELLLVLTFLPSLLALTATDFEKRLLPNRVMYPTMLLALALCWAWPDRPIAAAGVGALLGFGMMFVLFLIFPGFGFGDVKLAALMGLMLGTVDVLYALLLANILAGGGALALLLTRRVRLRGTMAYGPYMAAAAVWAMLLW